jgi:hypothetical protein
MVAEDGEPLGGRAHGAHNLCRAAHDKLDTDGVEKGESTRAQIQRSGSGNGKMGSIPCRFQKPTDGCQGCEDDEISHPNIFLQSILVAYKTSEMQSCG